MAPPKVRTDPAVARLLAVLESVRDRGAFSRADVARAAVLDLTRPDHEAGLLPGHMKDELRAAISVFVAALPMPPDRRGLTAFAEVCVEAARRLRPPPRHPGARLSSSELPRARDALMTSALYAEATAARDDDDLVRRAVTRALREERRGRRGLVSAPLADRDPLRGLLGLPRQGKVRVPRADIRAHLAHVEGGLGRALRDAARFAPGALRSVLGEELWGLCRPLGFADARHTRVLIGVSSSAVAQEVSLRKGDLLARLRTVPGFERVRDVRFEIVAEATLAVHGPRLRDDDV